MARRFFEWCGEQIPGFVSGALDYRGEFRVSGNSFFQANRFLLDQLVETALEQAEGESALELYAGVGLFSLPLCGRCREVIAVESLGLQSVALSEKELKIGGDLINQLTAPFEPRKFENEHQKKLQDMI